MKLARTLAIIAAFLWLGETPSRGAATLLPNGEQCFSATTSTSGGGVGVITALGAISAPGSGYVSASYSNVVLTGGSGFGATAAVTVTAGAVTAVILQNAGFHYQGGDSLSAANTSLGGSGSGFSIPVASIQGTGTGTGMLGALGAIVAGTGGITGSYGGVAVAGGTGSGATANVTVSGGGVTGFTVLNPGKGFVVGDTLTVVSGAIGGTTGFSIPVNSVAVNSALAGGSVSMFQPGTTTPKATWQDAAQTILNSQPIPLDANGCAVIYGTGSYRQILQDSLGNTVWDKITTDTSANNNTFWAGLAGGSPNAIVVSDPGFNATDGSIVNFTALSTNTGPATFNAGTGAISILKDTTAGPVALVGGEIIQNNQISLIYSAIANSFALLNPPIQSASGSTAPLCGAVGLKIINDNGAPNTSVDITADSVVMVSPTGTVINRSNVSMTLNFQVNGVNGLDTGSLTGATPYNIWLIDNGAAPAALASLSATSPTMPAGYTYKCRMSAIPTDGSSHLVQFITFGSETQITNNPAGTFVATALAGVCVSSFVGQAFLLPPTATVAIVELVMGASSQSIAVGYAFGSGPTSLLIPGGGTTITSYVRMLLTTPQTVFWCNGSTSNQMRVTGWVDKVNAH